MSKKNKIQLEKRNNWFTEYHDMFELGINGKRKLDDRIQYYNIEDFKNSTVIDLGCNMGQMSFQAEKWGANNVIGVDFDEAAIENANLIKEKVNSNVNFVVDDLDSNFFWNSIGIKDIVMFLSVIDTAELNNKYGILSKACSKTKKVMYFEGHGKEPASKYLENIINYTDFSQIIYKGNTPINRPFFKCTRDVLTAEEFIDKIKNLEYNKVAVVGKSLSGKSTFRKKLWQDLIDLKYEVIDDLRHIKKAEENNISTSIDLIKTEELKNFEKFVLFDYRALEYYDEFDVVFFITANEDLIGQCREQKQPLRSPIIRDFTTIKEVYTVESY